MQELKRPLLRFPALSSDGSSIAFACAGDIWTVAAEGGLARRITSHRDSDSHPVFSPDDSQLAFASTRTGGQNIYIASLKGDSLPRRLTYHSHSAPADCWSADGKWLYFNSYYDGLSGASYKISVDGGTPIRLHGDPFERHYNLAISPNGKTLLFNNNGDQWWRHGQNPDQHSDIWIVSEADGSDNFKRLTAYRGRNLWPMWSADGKSVYFVSDRDGEENLWKMPRRGDKTAEQVTEFDSGRVLRPSISRDGKWVVFERDFQIWRLNLESGESSAVHIMVQLDAKYNPVNHYSVSSRISDFELSNDGKKVVFGVHGDIFADLADKGDKVAIGGNSFKVTNTPNREGQFSWHPESEAVTYVSDRTGHNEIFLFDFKNKKETQITKSKFAKFLPKFSPDGKWLAFIQGGDQIRLMSTRTAKHRKFVRDKHFVDIGVPTSYCWSPDSQWVAFIATDGNFFTNIYVQHIRQKEARQVTFLSNVDAYGLHWSPNGKFLIFNTGQYRSEYQIARVDLVPVMPVFKEDDFEKLFAEPEKPKKQAEMRPVEDELRAKTIKRKRNSKDGEEEEENGKANKETPNGKKEEPPKVEIRFEGIKRRIRFLTDYKINAKAMGIRPDSKMLVFAASMAGQQDLWSMSLEEEKIYDSPKPLARGDRRGRVYFQADGKKFYYLDGGRIFMLGMSADGSKSGNPKSLATRAELSVDFHLEKMQSFEEAWRVIRDHFYDPQFHGCDWNAIGKQFREIVRDVQTNEEFREVLNLMVGELNASHLGARGGGGMAPDSYLGLLFDRKVLESKGQFKIHEVVADSPVTMPEKPAVAGEYLLAVDGQRLDGKTINLPELLQRKRGKKVKLLLNKRARPQGAREIVVQPVSGWQMDDLRYDGWVSKNVEYVKEKSDHRLGYVHIPAMSYYAYRKFIRDLDTEAYQTDGIVIDVRFNGGGHIAPFILDVLYRKAYTSSSFRDKIYTSDTNLAGSRILDKPVILLTNEHSGSNAEMFSEGFRKLGLGKVVGMPTAGAVIWTTAVRLLNGTIFRLPHLKASTLDGENTEGRGRPVDIEVDRKLGEDAAGVDSQLDAAVKALLKEI